MFAEYLQASEQMQNLSDLTEFKDSNMTIAKIQINSTLLNVVMLNKKLSERFINKRRKLTTVERSRLFLTITSPCV